jgi:hypothetical protein
MRFNRKGNTMEKQIARSQNATADKNAEAQPPTVSDRISAESKQMPSFFFKRKEKEMVEPSRE